MTTPKERYEARMKLKRDAEQPGHRADAEVTTEYALSLLDRLVSAAEVFADAYARKS